MSNKFIILGSIVDDDTTFWNAEYGWTAFKPFATIYDSNILTVPLPEGGYALQEQSEDGTPIALYSPIPYLLSSYPEGLILYEKLP
jgi:hypothetical protein